jgi:hypothetical protein
MRAEAVKINYIDTKTGFTDIFGFETAGLGSLP